MILAAAGSIYLRPAGSDQSPDGYDNSDDNKIITGGEEDVEERDGGDNRSIVRPGTGHGQGTGGDREVALCDGVQETFSKQREQRGRWACRRTATPSCISTWPP